MCLAAASSCQGSLPLGTALPTYDLLEVLHTQELHHGLPTSLGPVLPGPSRPAATGPKGGSRAPTRAGALELRAIAEIRLPPDGRSWNTIENQKPACAESVCPQLQKKQVSRRFKLHVPAAREPCHTPPHTAQLRCPTCSPPGVVPSHPNSKDKGCPATRQLSHEGRSPPTHPLPQTRECWGL